MFVSIWNYCKGYVIVEVRGYNIERFMNLALNSEIHFWDVEYLGERVKFKTTIKGFKSLKPFAKKAKCRLRITDKMGLPFFRFKYRKRSLLVIGSFIFVCLVYLLSSFIWLIEVKGNERLTVIDILTTLEANGYKEGTLKRNLDLREAERILAKEHPEIIWVGVSFEGTKLNIQITEAVPRPDMHETGEEIYSDLVAKRDGLITYIATSKGTPLVKKGDIVRKGEVLVSGRVSILDEERAPTYTQAKANVYAKTVYALEAKAPVQRIKKVYTGQVKKSYSIRVFDKIITLPSFRKADYEDSDTLITINQLKVTDKFPLPFYIHKTEEVEYEKEIYTIGEEDIQEELNGILYDNLLVKMGQDGEIIEYQVEYELNGNEITGKLYAVVQEEITVSTQIPEQEMIDDIDVQEGEENNE